MVRQRLARYPASSTESQWFFTREEVVNSPSAVQGMSKQDELRNRQKMIQTLWQLRHLSKLPQVVINTAATLLQRFYMRVSFQECDGFNAVGAAYFLAAKVEEKPINSKVVTSMLRFLQYQHDRNPNKQPDLNQWRQDPSEYAIPDFIKRRKDILHVEETMLRMECFDMNLRHPHALLGKIVKKVWNKSKGVGIEKDGYKVLECSWCIANDTLAGPTCLLYRPQLIAAACLAIACVILRQPLPSKPLPLSDQRTLWDLDREEGEEESEENTFQEDVYWLDLLEVTSAELKEPIFYILDTWNSAQDAFVGEESTILRRRIVKTLEELPPWPPTTPASASFTATREEERKPSIANSGEAAVKVEGAEPKGNGISEVLKVKEQEVDVKMEDVKP